MLRLIRRHLGLGLGIVVALASTVGPGAAGAAGTAAQTERFPERVDLPNGWAPEGITTGRGTTVYVGSLADGAIWQGDVRSGTGAVLVPGAGQAAVGVEYDTAGDRIWVAGGPTGAVRVYDARTGALLETYDFDAGFLNDLVVTRDAVYVTDSMIQQLAVIPLGRGGRLPPPSDATTLPLGGDIEFIAGQFNANGIVASGEWLIIVQSNKGLLFRVDPGTGTGTEIDLGGASVTSGDGLEATGRTLYVVRNVLNQVLVLRLDRSLAAASVVATLTSEDFDVPTTATVAAGLLWAVNARFGTPVMPTTTYWITQL